MKRLLMVAAIVAIATPALADEVGVRVGPVGAGVTVGDGHRDYDRDFVTGLPLSKNGNRQIAMIGRIKKENEDGTRTKTIIHDRD